MCVYIYIFIIPTELKAGSVSSRLEVLMCAVCKLLGPGGGCIICLPLKRVAVHACKQKLVDE